MLYLKAENSKPFAAFAKKVLLMTLPRLPCRVELPGQPSLMERAEEFAIGFHFYV